MKIILILLTLYLISGVVGCSNVIGYPGGSVVINCKPQVNKRFNSFCKDGENQCVYLKSDQMEDTWDHKDRVYLHEYGGDLIVTFRALSVQDTGSYQCGETEEGNQDVDLEVKADPCCLGPPKLVAGYVGENITISCSYPEKFKENIKFFKKLDGQKLTEVIRTTQSTHLSIKGRNNGRFSISDNRTSKVLTVNISEVGEDDGGVYYCGVRAKDNSLSYETFFTEIQLQVTGSSVRSTVSVCLALLLIGGLTLIIYIVIRKKRQATAHGDSSTQETSGTLTGPLVHPQVPLVENKQSRPASASDTGVDATRSDEDIGSTKQPPQDKDLTYITVGFLKIPGSPSDTPVTSSKVEPATEYATVKHHTGQE